MTGAARSLNLGSGNEPRAAAINLDLRRAPGVDVVADVRRLPFGDEAFEEIHASSLLEHFTDPYSVLDEIHRVLRPGGRVEIRVPSPWSVWGQLDRTHVFLADLRLWRDVLGGYLEHLEVRAEGARYRDSRVLRGLTLFAVRVLGWQELAEVWRFECRGKRTPPERRYTPWWLERSRE